MSQQLSFDLPARPALGRDDFFISPANALAVALIDATDTWPAGRLALIGPQGSGKTHLTHVWATQQNATVVDATDLLSIDIAQLVTHPAVAVENADKIAGQRDAETALFHLYNLAGAEQTPLLLTARSAPSRWPLTLPDLASRLGTVQQATLDAPDDTLLSAVMMKLFADRQLNPAPDLIPYLAKRIDRSFAAVATCVAELDKAALSEHRPLTRKFAARVLDGARLDNPDPSDA